jgi:hypothetical protein
MLHEKPVRYDPPGGTEDDMNMAWKSEKRRRMHLTQTSSSDAPTATAQGHQAPISYAICLSEPGEAAKDHEGPISEMEIVQAQDHVLLPRMDSGEEEETQELLGPHVIISEEDRASYAQKLLPNIRPPISVTETMSWNNFKLQVRQGRIRLAYYKVPTHCVNRSVTIPLNQSMP